MASSLILLFYAVVICYFLVLLSRATHVHSRFGLAFTGIIELGTSSIMAFSVMTLLGFGTSSQDAVEGETAVPYYILPFVILLVGVENMSAVTRAVYSVPVSYSVPDRVGLGLAKAGPSLLFTSLSDIAILTIIGLICPLRPIRDFCLFASILIVVHFWMLVTFYLTVLSIDCQRLELDDLMRQGAEKPAKQTGAVIGPRDRRRIGRSIQEKENVRSRSGSLTLDVANSTIVAGARKAWSARTARGGSLVLILGLLTTLYYANESRPPETPLSILSKNSDAWITPSLGAQQDYLWRADSMGAQIWHMIRPKLGDSVTVRILEPTRLLLPNSDIILHPTDLLHSLDPVKRPWLPRFKPIYHLLKVVVMPQILTASALYMILLYLLKDADLLDAQRNKRYAGEALDMDTLSGSGDRLADSKYRELSVGLAASFDDDISHVELAASLPVGVIITTGGKAALMQYNNPSLRGKVNIQTIVHNGASLVAIAASGRHGAILTISRSLIWFRIGPEQEVIVYRETRFGLPSEARLVIMKVGDVPSSDWSSDQVSLGYVLVAFDDGSVWEVAGSDQRLQVPATVAMPAKMGLTNIAEQRWIAVVCLQDTLTVWQTKTYLGKWEPMFNTIIGDSVDNAEAIAVDILDGSVYLAVGDSVGNITVWDASSGLPCCIVATSIWSRRSKGTSLIRRLLWASEPQSRCKFCSKQQSRRVSIGWTTDHDAGVIRFDTNATLAGTPCSCVFESHARLSLSRPSMDALLTPINKRTSRRPSRTAPMTPSPSVEGRSGSPMSHHNGSPNMLSLGSDTDDPDQSPSVSPRILPRAIDGTWRKIDEGTWPLHRGDLATVRGETFVFVTRHSPSIGTRFRSSWALRIFDLDDSLSLRPYDLPLDFLSPEKTGRRDPPISASPRTRSLAAVRGQRVASLSLVNTMDKANDYAHPLLAFTSLRLVSSSSEFSCFIVAGNQLYYTSFPKFPGAEDQQEDSNARRSTAHHIAPLAPPTIITNRRQNTEKGLVDPECQPRTGNIDLFGDHLYNHKTFVSEYTKGTL